jgi:hypothetical protein
MGVDRILGELTGLPLRAMVNIIAGMHSLTDEAAYEKKTPLQQLQPVMDGRSARQDQTSGPIRR